MTQANILELAKQGNPQAIASLMNLSLQPKGVTAQTTISEGCLHVFLHSKQLLSQSAIVQFVQQGLAALGATSIQQVKIYARKDGKEALDWTDGFQLILGSSPAPNATVAGASMAGNAVTQVAQSPTTPPSASAKPQLKVPQFQALQPPSAQAQTALVQPAAAQNGVVGRSPNALAPKGAGRRRVATGTPVQKLKFYLRQFMYKVRTNRRYAMAVGISASAFIGGGVVALVASSHTKSVNQIGLGGAAVTNQVSPSADLQSPELQQAQATQYLAQMNKAQQAFYQTNNRLATSLEELERSASVISRSTNYTYELTSSDQTQANITAIPRMGGLKSYSSTIRFNSTAAGAPTTLICGSNQVSKTPPAIAPTSNGSVQCSPDASPIAAPGM
jgi:Type IV pilin-like G and H, putative